MNFQIKIVLLFVNLKLLLDYSSAYDEIEESDTVFNPKQIELFFLAPHILSSGRKDSVCWLSEGKKQALCKRIFLLPLFTNKGVHFNTTAFFVNKPLCVRNRVKFTSLEFFMNEIIEQEMYPCYGRHYPVGTDYKTDTYYDKFYVSNGLHKNSVIVYIHKYNIDSDDWYSVFSYHKNMHLPQLEDFIINVQDVRAELELNQIIRSTSDRKLLEYIYVRGKDKNDWKDSTVCKLDVARKTALCELIFNRYRYKINFSTELHKAVFSQVKILQCQKKRVKIVYSKRYQNVILEEYMYPCFSKNRLTSNINLLKEFNMIFYVSEGSWKNSVFIYYSRETLSNEQFYLIELLENLCIDCLKPNNIMEKDVRNESETTYLEIQKLNHGIDEVFFLMAEKLQVNMSMVIRNMKTRQTEILSKYPLSLRKNILFHNKTIYTDIESRILSLINQEEKSEFETVARKYNIRMLTDIDLLIRLSQKFFAGISYIKHQEKDV